MLSQYEGGNMRRSKRKVVGYMACRADKGRVVICVELEPGSKRYLEADLAEVLEVLTGRQAWTRIYA